MPGIALEIRRKCKVCGKVFLVKKLDSQFCSKRCGDVYRKRIKDANKREERLSEIILHIPDAREYISVKEAVAIFGVERDTIYRLIKKGKIPAINLGTRLTRIKREGIGKTRPQTLQPRTRRLLHRRWDMQEISLQRQYSLVACTQVLHPFTADRQLRLYPQRRNR